MVHVSAFRAYENGLVEPCARHDSNVRPLPPQGSVRRRRAGLMRRRVTRRRCRSGEALLNSRDPPRHLDRCLSSGCHPFANLGDHQPHRGTDDPVMRQKPALAARSRWLSSAEGGGVAIDVHHRTCPLRTSSPCLLLQPAVPVRTETMIPRLGGPATSANNQTAPPAVSSMEGAEALRAPGTSVRGRWHRGDVRPRSGGDNREPDGVRARQDTGRAGKHLRLYFE